MTALSWVLTLRDTTKRLSVMYSANVALRKLNTAYILPRWAVPPAPRERQDTPLRSMPPDAYTRAKMCRTLLSRHPNEAWLHGVCLRLLCQVISIKRLKAMKSTKVPHSRGPIIASSRNGRSDEALKIALEIASHGAKLAPQNAFFDMMRAYFLLGLCRNREAQDAVHSAARKSEFDDYLFEEIRRNMRNVILPETKLSIYAGMMLPHYPAYRDVVEFMMEMALNAERANDHARALSIYEDLVRISQSGFRNERVIIGAAFWSSILRTICARGSKEMRFMDQMVADFSTYARKHGRSNLAEMVHSVADEIYKFEIMRRAFYARGLVFSDSVNNTIIQPLRRAQVATEALIGQIAYCFELCIVALVMLIIATALAWWRRRHPRSPYKASDVITAPVPLTPVNVITPTAVAMWLPMGALILLLAICDVPAGAILGATPSIRETLTHLCVALVMLSGALLTALVCAFGAWCMRKRLGKSQASAGIRRYVFMILNYSLAIATAWLWLAQFVSYGAVTKKYFGALALLSFITIIIWIATGLLGASQNELPVARWTVLRYAMVMLLLIAIGSWTCTVVQYRAANLRTRLDSIITAQLKYGEVGFARRMQSGMWKNAPSESPILMTK